MQKLRNMRQSGFTLVELIIVIVILGILAAVAIPKLTDTTAAAYEGVQTATLGALKSAWSIAYAVKKSPPNTAEVIAQMVSPTCTGTAASFTCGTIGSDGVMKTNGTALATFAATETGTPGTIASPADIAILSGS